LGKKKRGAKMERSLFREMQIRIALDEWLSEYKTLTEEKDLIIQQQKIISMMREMHVEFDLSVMSSNDEPFSREVIFLYDQLSSLSRLNIQKLAENM